MVGLAVYLLLSRSGPLGTLGWLFTPRAMILAQVLLVLPLVTGLTAAAVEAVPAELFAQVVGLAAIAAGFGRSTSEVGAVLIVGGNIAGRTRVLTTAIVLETGKGDFAAALALGALLLGLAFLANLAILRLQARPAP